MSKTRVFISKLCAFRKQENIKQKGISDIRHSYCDKITTHIKICSFADLHRIVADPDPLFDLNAGSYSTLCFNPDPTFPFDADPNPDPAPIKVLQIYFFLHTDPPRLHFEPPVLYCERPRPSMAWFWAFIALFFKTLMRIPVCLFTLILGTFDTPLELQHNWIITAELSC